MKTEKEIEEQIYILREIAENAKAEGKKADPETYTMLALMWVLGKLD